jgi:hypothetical protein
MRAPWETHKKEAPIPRIAPETMTKEPFELSVLWTL